MNLSINRQTLAALSLVASLLVCAAAGPNGIQASAQSPPQADCYACLVIDDEGRALWGRRASLPLPNASTTKMLTALVARDLLELDREVEVSAVAAALPGGKLSLLPGERWSVEELLWGLLLGSSNDAAVALAQAASGSESAFVALLNAEAQRIGALDTFFVTSHGLDEPGHVSTATDLALIAAELLADPVLADIVATESTTLTSSQRQVIVPNTNLLVGSYPGAIGVKTGFTSDAGNVLVAAAELQDRTVIVVTMRSDDTFADARAMLDYGFARLRRGILLKAMTSIGDVVFESGSTGVVASRAVRGIARPTEVTVEFVPDAGVGPPVEAGERLGIAVVRDGSGKVLDSAPALASRTVGGPSQGGGISSVIAGVLDAFGPLLGEG